MQIKIKLITALLFIGVTFTILPSCKKYPDGPSLSLRSRKARAANDWKMEYCSVNGTDQTAAVKAAMGDDYGYLLEKNGNYTMKGNFPDSGTWEVGPDGDDIYFTSSTPGTIQGQGRLLRLKNKELWFKQVQSNGDVYILHFVPR